jgi:hypothetical protein
MNTVVDNHAERKRKETLDSYFRGFNATLHDAKWLREIFGKPTDKEWLAPKLKAWINKLNSWATSHVIQMATTSTLDEIFYALQTLTETKSLDSDGSASGRTSHLHHMREQLIADGDVKDTEGNKEVLNALNALSEQQKEQGHALLELREGINSPLGTRKSVCEICPHPRNQTHATTACFNNPSRNNGNNGRPARDKRDLECFNCGKKGHFSYECRSGRQHASRLSNGYRRKCDKCGRNNHETRNCRAGNNSGNGYRRHVHRERSRSRSPRPYNTSNRRYDRKDRDRDGKRDTDAKGKKD